MTSLLTNSWHEEAKGLDDAFRDDWVLVNARGNDDSSSDHGYAATDVPVIVALRQGNV